VVTLGRRLDLGVVGAQICSTERGGIGAVACKEATNCR